MARPAFYLSVQCSEDRKEAAVAISGLATTWQPRMISNLGLSPPVAVPEQRLHLHVSLVCQSGLVSTLVGLRQLQETQQ